MDEALSFEPRKKPRLVITFDDGYADNYHFAFPLLQKYRLPALIYMISGGLSPKSLHWDNQIFFSIDQGGPVSYTHLTLPTNREV